MDIPAVGSFQDGGLRNNNPINIALAESKEIWPGVRPDVVLSLGTGTEEPLSPAIPLFRNVFKDGFLLRLSRSLIHSLNGEGPWRELMNRLDNDQKAAFFRMNIALPHGSNIRLDDAAQMTLLKDSVQNQSNLRKDQEFTVISLLSSTFYFELDGMPVFYNDLYYCSGTVRCRYDARKVFRSFRQFSSQMDLLTDLAYLAPLQEESICDVCNIFSRPITLRVRDLSDLVPIYIQLEPDVRRHISGSPQSIGWYVKQQCLDAAFGTSNHGIPRRLNCLKCKRGDAEPVHIEKKRKSDQLHRSAKRLRKL